MDENEREALLRAQQEEQLRMQQENYYQTAQQKPKKKSKVGFIILIVFVCLLPIIIIISIMLVSMGVLIFNNSVQMVETAPLSIEIAAFNTKYEMHMGNDKVASDAIALVQRIKVDNNYEEHKVDVEARLLDGSVYSLNDITTSQFNHSSWYDITSSKNDEGYINHITIKEKSIRG